MTQRGPVVGVSEGLTLLFIFLSSKVFLTHIAFLLDYGMNASWVIPLLNTMVGLAGVLLLLAVLNRSPGRDLVETGEQLTGPYINSMFAIYYLAVFVAGGGLTLRSISERVVAGFLPDTPISVVTVFFITGTLVVSYLGIEAVARTARFLVGVLVVFAMILVVLTIPLWQFNVIYPLWGPGPGYLLKGVLENTGDFVQILLLGIIYPFLPRGRAASVGVWGVLIAGLWMFLFILVTLLVFTYPTATELTLPSFELARIINIGRFGQRMEVLFLPVWVFGNMIFLSVSVYAGAAVLTRLCKLDDYRPFVLSVAVLTVVIAFIPQSALQAAKWNHDLLSRHSFWPLAAILLVLLTVARFRGQGRSRE